jgi:integrase
MANFNIVVLPAKVLRDGTHKVRIAISHRGDTRYIPTNYRVDSPSEVSNNQIVSRGDAGYLNIQLRKKLNDLQETYDAIDDPDIYTCSQLVEILKRKGGQEKKVFETVFNEYVEMLQEKGQTSSARLYSLAKDRFEDFYKTKEILLETIQPMDIVRFDTYLRKRGSSAATIKTYMSLIKVIIDYACKMKYIKYEVEPFQFYDMPTYEPRELWFTVEEFQKVYEDKPTLYNYGIMRDIWLLTFFLGGANIVDILNYNFKNKTSMRYQRTKTKNTKKDSGWTVFDLQPEALAIIEKYISRGGKLQFGRYLSKTTISQLFVRDSKKYMEALGIEKRFILMAARKTFFQIGFDNKESTDILDYCVGHARSKRMAMNYAMVKPEMATACMRRVFDIAIGAKLEQSERNRNELEPKLEQSVEKGNGREQKSENSPKNEDEFTTFLM